MKAILSRSVWRHAILALLPAALWASAAARDALAVGPATADLLGARLEQGRPGEVMVAQVRRAGVAHRHGIRPGEQIVSIDGVPIASLADANRALAAHRADQDLKIVVKPSAQSRSVTIPAPPPADGYENAKLQPTGRIGFTFRPGDGHITVSQLYAGGPADKAGVHSGDMIAAIDGHPVANRKDVYDILQRLQAGNVVHLRIVTTAGGAARDVPVTLGTPVEVHDRRLVTRPAPEKPLPAVQTDTDDDWLDANQYEDIRDPYLRALDTDFDG